MSISGIRTQIATALEVISGLKIYTTWPSNINQFPCVVITPVSGGWNNNLNRGTQETRWEVLLLLNQQGDVSSSQTSLDAYLDTTGAYSIKAAIEGYTAYYPECNYAYVTGWRDYGDFELNKTLYLSVKFEVITR